jgi:hypothetical protein
MISCAIGLIILSRDSQSVGQIEFGFFVGMRAFHVLPIAIKKKKKALLIQTIFLENK